MERTTLGIDAGAADPAPESALRASEARLRLALDVAELGTWTWDLATGAGELDARGAQIIGLVPGALADVAAAQLAVIHPDDRARTQAAAAAGVASGEPFDLHYRVLLPDGSIRHVASRAVTVRDDAGRPSRLVGTNRDVTAEREAEAERERLRHALEVERTRLATVFAQTPSVLAIVRGPEYVLEMANAAYLAINGHRAVLGKPLLEAVPELRGQGFETLLERVVATGESYVGREIPIRLSTAPDAAPEERFFDFVYLPLVEPDASGAPRRVGVIAHGNDVTAQVRARRDVERVLIESERARADADAARREAEEARVEAEAANRAKAEFLAVMSHELRTPLNAIGGYAELMEMGIRGPVTADQREDLRRVQASQRHLLGLINEVLNYAKLETGAVHFDLAAVQVREALVGAEALVAPQARAKGLTLTVDACPVPLAVRADAEKLRQILVNLLSNAVKFTGPGARIVLACVVEGDRARVSVRDTGIGIAAEQLERIFEPFVQVRSDLTRPHEGTGLGLAISRDLARGMSGDLTVESTPGVGTTFTLLLPIG